MAVRVNGEPIQLVGDQEANRVEVTGVAPSVTLRETDQTAPAGRYRIRVQGDLLIIERATAVTSLPNGDETWDSQDEVLSVSSTGLAGATLAYRAVSASGNFLAADWVLAVDTSGGAVTLTLPTALLHAGRTFLVKDVGGVLETNPITIATQGAETIDGESAVVLRRNYGAVHVFSNGANWFLF